MIVRQRGRKTNNDNLLKAVASRRTKLGLDDKPWSYNRVGLERAGGHKWKFSYGTVGEALEQLQVENKERQGWVGMGRDGSGWVGRFELRGLS